MIFNQTGNSGGGGDIPIIFDEMYDDVHPSKITIDYSGKDIPENFFNSSIGFMQHVKLAIIKCNSITDFSLINFFEGIPLRSKIKVKANGTIGYRSFGSTARYTKIWIPNTVTSISGDTPDAGPFFDPLNSTVQLYCEPTSQPSGWGQYWNSYNNDGALLSTTWGVTEAAFDAM